MKHYLFAILLIFCSAATSSAQVDDEDNPPPIALEQDGENIPDPEVGRFILDGGITKMRPWKLNDQLFGVHTFDQFTAVGFGFGFADETCPESEDFIIGTDITYAWHMFLMQQYRGTAANGDLMNYKLKGWELMTSSFAVNLIRNEHVDFVFGLGVSWGNWKLYSDNLTQNTGDRLYKNPFVAPMMRTELRFNVWRFTFGARVSYRRDITNDNWKEKDSGLEPIPGYLFNEMQFMFYIGLREINP